MVSVSYGTSTLRYKERKKKEEEKVSIDRVKLFIVINYRSLSAAGSSASRQSWKEGKRALLKPARASLFHVLRQRKSSSLVLPAPEKNIHTHTHSPPFALPLSLRSLFLPMRGRALGSLVRCSRGGCVSRGSMWDQWLALTNSQRAPLISRLRDQNLREREERGEEKEEKKLRRRADLKLHSHRETRMCVRRDTHTDTHLNP